MKKSIFLCIIIIIIPLLIFTQEEFDLGEKKVVGEDKKQIEEDINIIKNTNEMQTTEDDLDLKIKEEKIDVLTDLPDINIQNKKRDPARVYFTEIDNKPIQNYFVFGLGGYKRIDAFKYVIDYSKKDRQNDLFYSFYIDRIIRGEDRQNSNIDSDTYSGEIKYNPLYLSLSHKIRDTEFPGQDTPFIINSYKQTRTSELQFNLEFLADKNNTFYLQTDLYNEEVSSIGTPVRSYKNLFYQAALNYTVFFDIDRLHNYLHFDSGFYQERMPENQISTIFINNDTKVKISGDKSLEFILKLGTEFYEKNKEKKPNTYQVGTGANKYFSKNFLLGLYVEKENKIKLAKDLMNNFEFDNDLLPYYDLKNEDNLKAELISSFQKDIIYLEGVIRHQQTKNKIIYEQDLDTLINEIPIRIYNHDEELKWQEIEIKNSYLLSFMRTELKYIYNNLKNIPFNPQHRIMLNLIFQYKRLQNIIEGKYYSVLYGKAEQENKTGEYKTINLYNTYNFNRSLDISFNILNLFNYQCLKKTNYPMDQRKMMLEFKVKF